MPEIVRAIFKIVRAKEADLPVLQEGELGYAIDKNVLFIGDPEDGNVAINKDVVTNEVLEAKEYLLKNFKVNEVLTPSKFGLTDTKHIFYSLANGSDLVRKNSKGKYVRA